jgi:hypothetical protein
MWQYASSKLIDPMHSQGEDHVGAGYIGSRAPRRVTITLNYAAYKGLESRSGVEGRSMSNLAAFILENALTRDLRSNA